MKIVINVCHGGFGLSHEAIMRYAQIKGIKLFLGIWSNGNTIQPYNGEKDASIYYSTKPLPINLNVEKECNCLDARDIVRMDSALICVVEELGEKANGEYAKLKIVEIPDDVKWVIEAYDGAEWVAEEHRTWP